jgi:hypothetical protein
LNFQTRQLGRIADYPQALAETGFGVYFDR